jgi:carbon storage regulator
VLIVTRKPHQSVYIGEDIVITVLEVQGQHVRLGIRAPQQFKVYREEIFERIRLENQQAAAVSSAALDEAAKLMPKKPA